MSKLNFRIVEGETFNVNMEEFTHDVQEGLTHEQLMKKHQVGRSRLYTLIKELRKKGLVKESKPRNYFFDETRNRWVVSKRLENRRIYFKSFKTEEEAKKDVERLRRKGWKE